jgi:hypothetical protein
MKNAAPGRRTPRFFAIAGSLAADVVAIGAEDGRGMSGRVALVAGRQRLRVERESGAAECDGDGAGGGQEE